MPRKATVGRRSKQGSPSCYGILSANRIARLGVRLVDGDGMLRCPEDASQLERFVFLVLDARGKGLMAVEEDLWEKSGDSEEIKMLVDVVGGYVKGRKDVWAAWGERADKDAKRLGGK